MTGSAGPFGGVARMRLDSQTYLIRKHQRPGTGSIEGPDSSCHWGQINLKQSSWIESGSGAGP